MDPVIDIVNRSNQRGGRMLSVIDLLEAGTLSRPQACWLLARIVQGSSFLVGARPGGAGKTAIQGALLGMLPAAGAIRLATPDSGWEESRQGDCVVAYEIGRGNWEAYVWGDSLVRLTALGRAGCRIVTNLHADTLEQAREQVAVQCGAGEDGLRAFEIFIPVRMSGHGYGRIQRVVEQITWYGPGGWQSYDESQETSVLAQGAIGPFLDRCLAEGLRTIEAVRAAWLADLPALTPSIPDEPGAG
ncbi:MAG: hypothetical protein GXX94_04430 [Chloroflexi bacterium]|nr:hypothetical protein [Chloroflexota bacterium]